MLMSVFLLGKGFLSLLFLLWGSWNNLGKVILCCGLVWPLWEPAMWLMVCFAGLVQIYTWTECNEPPGDVSSLRVALDVLCERIGFNKDKKK